MNCLICNSKTNIFPARIYPFVRERIRKPDVSIGFAKCPNCDFAFFDYRLSEKEMTLLYQDYRGKEYQESRQKYEEFYTPEFNSYLGKNKDELRIKEANLLDALKKADLKRIQSVLDFGGDKGQNIDLGIFEDKEKYLYDISDLEPVAGVKKLPSLNRKFDLVISQHTLEHVPDPLKMVKEAVSVLNPKGYFYFELPFDDPTESYNFSKKIKFRFFRNYFRKQLVRRNKNFWMHEHINFFNKKSVKEILKQAHLKPLLIKKGKSDLVKLIYGIAQK